MASAMATPTIEATSPISSIRGSGFLSRLSRTPSTSSSGFPRRAILFDGEAGRRRGRSHGVAFGHPAAAGAARVRARVYAVAVILPALADPVCGPRKLDGG